MAEAALAHHGAGRFRAFSAGSFPTGHPHPMALETLRDRGLPTEGLRSKSWDEFAAPGAPEIDVVLTVCDNARAETCPVWPGHPVTAHWGVEDPAACEGPEDEQRLLFRRVFETLESRILALVRLTPPEDPADLQERLEALAAADPSADVRGP
jgi:protein-tyrosine-phosphatase